MANCLIPTGFSRTCSYKIGGVKNIYLANIDYVTAGKSSLTNIYTGVTMSGSQKFYKFEGIPGTIKTNETLTGDNSKYFKLTLDFVLDGITQAKREILESLGLAKVLAIIQMQDNTYWMYGFDSAGLTVPNGGMVYDSGAAIDDPNTMTVQLVGGSSGLANEVLASALTTVLA